YRLLDAVGVPTLKARPARITYRFPDREQLVRNAALIETDDEAMKRLGATRQIDEQHFTNARDRFTASDTATIAFGAAMIGNFDWCLKMTPEDAYRCDARHPLWNLLALVGDDGRARPLIYDFDVAGTVTGRHHWFADAFNEAFVDSRSHAAVEVIGQV